MLDAYRQEQLVNASDLLNLPLISPFQPDQPLQRELRYHTPPQFSKEVVEGIRHAAGRLFKVGMPSRTCSPIGVWCITRELEWQNLFMLLQADLGTQGQYACWDLCCNTVTL